MKFTKKCDSAQHKISISNRRRSSAGMFYTSSAGAVTSLILKRNVSNSSILITIILMSILVVNNTYADYTISMTSSGAQEIDVLPSSNPSGIGTKISSDAVTVSTTCPSGYNLTTTTSVNNNNLYLNGNSSNNTEGSFFSPSNGTTSLGSSANTWGFYQNGSTVPTASSIFKAVPASNSSAATIRTGSTSGDDSFNIYYGVAINNSLAPGSYKMIPDSNNSNVNGSVVYYLTMSSSCLKPYMQDVDDNQLAEMMPNVGDSTTLYDKRDEQEYTVAKLADGKYWMTKNLNLAGGTTLSSVTTDFDSSYSIPTTQGWQAGGTLPESNASDFSNDNYAYVYNSGNTTCSSSSPCYSYYSWDAATLGSGRNISTDNTDAPYSICPKGWKLPSTYNGTNDSTDYRALMIGLGGSNSIQNYTSSTTPKGATIYNKLVVAPYNYVLPGYYRDNTGALRSGGSYGFYWSSTSYSNNTDARYLRIYSNAVDSARSYGRRDGFAVRCVYQPPEPDPCEGHENELYCKVKAMSKGTQTLAQLRAAITVPTSADRTQDTSNSGVYEYNASVFGTSSDASNTSKIYYYRGVLENSVGSYGSDGSAVTYPNYVKLGNTCWRIVRTTGSGGVKMIYNGTYGATTSGSCANTEANAQVTTSAFNGTSSDGRYQIVRVGYTHNSTYAVNTSKSGTIAQIFGSNSNPGANNTRSTIKEYIEDTWYANNMTSYTSKLEASAGYCNDRTMNTSTSWTTPLAESATIASTYGTSDLQAYYFGAFARNTRTAQAPSLTCGNKYSQIDRSTVDLYRYVANSTGVSNQLKYPAALLTADEAAFAGSGWGSSTTPYHANSFLRSGSNFWLLSPSDRFPNGLAIGFRLYSDGNLYNDFVEFSYGVRPAISLTPGTMAASGTGTAADPWIVNP